MFCNLRLSLVVALFLYEISEVKLWEARREPSKEWPLLAGKWLALPVVPDCLGRPAPRLASDVLGVLVPIRCQDVRSSLDGYHSSAPCHTPRIVWIPRVPRSYPVRVHARIPPPRRLGRPCASIDATGRFVTPRSHLPKECTQDPPCARTKQPSRDHSQAGRFPRWLRLAAITLRSLIFCKPAISKDLILPLQPLGQRDKLLSNTPV